MKVERRAAYKRKSSSRSILPEQKDQLVEEEFVPYYAERPEKLQEVKNTITKTPSEFTAFAIKVKGEPFSFDGRRYLLPMYDSPAKRKLFKTARQVEKSTTLGNMQITYNALIPHFHSLYVSPTATQTKTFSNDRIKEVFDTPGILNNWVESSQNHSVFRKMLVNRSVMLLLYAYLTVGRIRGNYADMICLDEVQDILIDHIPVIEECMSHSPFKFEIFSGTPLTLDNGIEYFWSQESTQNEWLIPCENCGGGDKHYWNLLGEDNISPTGLVCSKCGKPLNPQSEKAQWVAAFPKRNMEGYHISQLMVKWVPWDSILDKYERYPRRQFFNEVLGESHDSASRPLIASMIQANCSPTLSMYDPKQVLKKRAMLKRRDVFAGIDWGTGDRSYTVLSLGAYINDRFEIFYIHRFTGKQAEPTESLTLIKKLIEEWGVNLVGVDYGQGFFANNHLTRAFGRKRILVYQYVESGKRKVFWESGKNRFLLSRTDIMTDLINAIRKGDVFRFAMWDEFKEPYAQDMMNIHSEYSEFLRRDVYGHNPANPDDSFHSILYCFLASMIKHPRPDIILPDKDVKGTSVDFLTDEEKDDILTIMSNKS